MGESAHIHVPNLCVAQLCCDSYVNENDLKILCEFYGVRQHVYEGDECLDKFFNFAIRYKKKSFKNFVCIAHNAKAFDAQYILKHVVENKKHSVPEVILNGRNIIKLEIGMTKFIDSLNYLPMKLSSFPKTFDLAEGVETGFFPHLFSTLENQEYIGSYPNISYYTPDSMGKEEHEAFLPWYKDVSCGLFNFKNELKQYCIQDFNILRQSCMKFRKIFLQVGKVDPFAESVTIVSACSRIYRKNFLHKNTIGLIPHNGYVRADQHSQKSIEWLLWEEKCKGRKIVHAGRTREHVLIEGPRVDGYLYELNTKGAVYQFHGCFYHGCPRCYSEERHKILIDQTSLSQRFENTKNMSEKIISFGYKLIEMWECDFDKN